MAEAAAARKLASIVAIDVAGYSRRTEADEEAAIRAVSALKAKVIAEMIPDASAAGAISADALSVHWHALEEKVVRDLILSGTRADGRDYVVKLRGHEVLDERRSIAEVGARDGSTFLVTNRRRRPVR